MSVLLILSMTLTVVYSWGLEGHQATAGVAMSLLNGQSQTSLNGILASGDNLVSVSDWADQIKSNPAWKWASALHYADIPDWACSFAMSDCLNNICVVGAITNYSTILGVSNDPDMQQVAVKFLTHFVGDVHQPLHVGFVGDLGGNKIEGTYDDSDFNLHSVWDTGIIEDRLADFNNDTSQWTAYLVSQLTKVNTSSWSDCPSSGVSGAPSVICPEHWANGSAQLACSNAYVDADGTTHLQSGFDLGGYQDDYYNRNLPIIEEQIMKGGVRLAALFNQIFSTSNTEKDQEKQLLATLLKLGLRL